MGFMRFALKSSVAGGVVYYSAQEGLWSSPEETTDLYCRIYNRVAPYVRKNVPEDVTKALPVLPSFSTMSTCTRGTWNNAVMTSIKFLSELPTHMANGIDYVMSMPMVSETVSNVKGLADAAPVPGKAQ